jgi:hypothetical protein
VEVIRSGDVLMWPGCSKIIVQSLMMLLDNKRVLLQQIFLFFLSPSLSSLSF